MFREYPPAYSRAAQPRIPLDEPIFVANSAQGSTLGIHLIIEGTTYFIERAEARRIARRILFSEVLDAT